jgi:hypothetical protein
MLNQLSTTEKLAAAASSCVVAALALTTCLNLTIKTRYADFIVGSLTWQAGAKLQDLIAAPVFIAVLFFGFLFFSLQLAMQKQQFGSDYSTKLSNQLLWWSVPSVAAISSLILGSAIDVKILAISVVGIVFIAITSAYRASMKINFSPDLISLSAFVIILTAIIPLEIALVLGRAPITLVGDINLARFVKTAYIIAGFGVVIGTFYSVAYSEKLSRLLPKLVLIGQLGLPTLFLTLYPARLLQPSGALTKYETTVWLKILVVGMIVWGLSDVISRYRKYSITTDWIKLLSPIALFALLVGLKVGNTVAPHINPDDYHFGESLLGWWSYLHGTIPYVGYVPAHGLIHDDLTLFLSSIFYDGSAGSIAEVGRLSFAMLAFAAFISIYYFSGSIGLAFVSTFFLGGRLSWIFLTPFLCLWLSRSLRESPSKWLSVWMLTAPIVVLGVPPQGLLLVTASGVIAAYSAWRLLRNPVERDWTGIGISLTILTVLGLATPLVSMLFGAIRYVLENGPINQVAYGVPWALSWNSGTKAGFFVFEAIRMSWVAIPIVCLSIIYSSRRDPAHQKNVLFPAIVVLLFVLLLIPYSMGRIDPHSVSRPGIIATFGWAILLPVVTWDLVRSNYKVPLILLIVCMSSNLNLSTLSFSNFISAMSSKIGTSQLKDGQSAGLANIGQAYVQEDHWGRLTKLNALLNAKLSPDETYLDLTSRNAQYFYLNRRPVMVVTAPYNMVPPSQQIRAVEQLSKNIPALALLEGDNIIHDGGGLALRTPYLYRFMIENYIPRFEDGFILGYKKKEPLDDNETTIEVVVKNLTDANWIRGINRVAPAFIVSDPILISYIKVGDQVRIGNDEIRKIQRVWIEGNAVWLEGSPFAGYPGVLHVIVKPQIINEYRASLFQRAFSRSDYQKIPVAWGRSEESLKRKMAPIKSLDGISPSLHHLIPENGSYKVNGDDPFLSFELSHLHLSGRDAGLLRFDFSCIGQTSEPKIQVFWWGDDQQNPVEASSIKFTASIGTLIVPVDASPRWLMLNQVKGIRIDLDNPSACSNFRINDIGLFQRNFE